MSRFFDLDSPIMRTLSFLFDCMVMSFLFLLCCLPVFTTGAAFSALYHCAGYMADGSDAGIRDFFGAFRRSFKRATPIWLLALALGLLLTANLLLIKNMPGGIQIFMLAGDLCLLLWMVLAGISLFPLIHLHPDVSVRQLIPKAFLFSILYLRWYCCCRSSCCSSPPPPSLPSAFSSCSSGPDSLPALTSSCCGSGWRPSRYKRKIPPDSGGILLRFMDFTEPQPFPAAALR